MTYRVEITARAARDLARLFRDIDAARADVARAWFNGLQAAILSLAEHPGRRAVAPEDRRLRHLLYGKNGYMYRVIFKIDERKNLVTIPHIRHGFRAPMKRREGKRQA